MTFTLTEAVVHAILDPVAQGDWAAFQAAIDEDVVWIIADPVNDARTLAGTYDLKRWQEEVGVKMSSKIQGGIGMIVDSFDIIGLKLVVEAHSDLLQKNGSPYKNRFAWFFEFSAETGKIVRIREYLNTALLAEVNEGNP